ncbi:MAG TPA: phosphate ABC transporter permease subunit PstC [Candidatus Limnocylindrales bacterium]|nr:phosphate ABC transporter permease subunit PstC [Candidatus Limnocylindrales bacterium]
MTPPPVPGRPPVARGRSVVSRAVERLIEVLIRACGFSAIFFVFAILVFVVGSGAEFIVHRLSIPQFLFSTEWVPTSLGEKRYGTLALIIGTVSVTSLAMAIAVPFGLGAAVFVSEFTTGRRKEILKVVIELLAAIPSVVWGFIGLVLINPLIIAVFHAPIGLNVLNGGIILGLMSVPIIVSIGEDALKAVPDSYREASLAMGASRWQTVTKVLIPAARNGLLAAVLLGVARAIGETIAVLMATGHAVQIPHSPLDSVRTLTATIAAELGESARGSDHYQALFAIGVLLFLLTFAVNLTADLMVRGRKGNQ